MNEIKQRKIAIVTSTRADWGLLFPVARALKECAGVDLSIIATNMHLDATRGMTVYEIEADGFEVACRVEMTPADDSPRAVAEAMCRCLAGMARAFDELKPDIIVILGDRYEMLAVASAATIMHIPIAHISGGEITEGAIDDNIRHAISKLSSLHFATTNAHRNRLIAMGEQPSAVVNTGALGVYNIAHLNLLSKPELEAQLGFEIKRPAAIVTYHPATNDTEASPSERFAALLSALDRFPDLSLIMTYPNNDPHSEQLIGMIEGYARLNPERVHVVPSLGRLRYLSALHAVDLVIGNSSSGVVEVPSAHIPTVDIGIRQRGRTAADSVIHCTDDSDSIAAAIDRALSSEGKKQASEAENPYFNNSTVKLIVDKLLEAEPSALLPKRFHDI